MEFSKRFFLGVLIISFILGLLLLFIYGYYLDKGYHYLSEKDAFSSIVTDRSENRAVARIKLEDGQKFIIPFARNLNYQVYDLHDVIRRGDLLLKTRGSDTVIVKRYSDTYVFVINQVIDARK